MLVTEDYCHHAWVYFLKLLKADSGDAFRKCLADARADDGVLSNVEIVKYDNGGGVGLLILERCANSSTPSWDSPKPIALNITVW